MLVKQKKCLECEEPIIGRRDKKFCSDFCRTAYHNSVSHQNESSLRAINKVLLKNRKILLETQTKRSRITKTSVYVLQEKGFDFSYYTHCRPDRTGQVVVYCYEIGYIRIEENQVQIMANNRR
jgi:hypothetical protein